MFVPLVVFLSLNNDSSLNASVSPDTVPMSGEPCMFVTLTKLPISNLVVEFCIVSKSLAFSIVTNFCEVVSTSKPFTYALPGDNPIANLASDAVALKPSCKLSLSAAKIPRLLPSSLCSLTSMSNG